MRATELAARLASIVARGSTPQERVAAEWPSPPVADRKERLALWREFLDTDDAGWHRMMEARGLDAEVLTTALPEPLEAPEPWPPWAVCMRELFERFGQGPRVPCFSHDELRDAVDDAVHISMLADALAPWLEPALAELRLLLQDADLPTEGTLERSLLAGLARHWYRVSVQVLLHPVQVVDVVRALPIHKGERVHEVYLGPGRATRDGWLRLWSAFPVLARTMARVWEAWLEATRELLARYRNDREALSDLVGRPLGQMVRIDLGAGDVHDGGRSVAIAHFEGGLRLVYKPRDLRIAEFYEELLIVLDADDELGLRHCRISRLCREQWGWEHFVERTPCCQPEEVTSYYRCVGAHARLIQLLGGSDMHGENVISSRGHPVVVDAETMFTHHRDRDTWPDDAVDSPMSSGLLSLAIETSPGARAIELGALSRAVQWASPRLLKAFGEEPRHAPQGTRRHSRWAMATAVPLLGEMPQPIDDHFDALLAGYDWMDRRLEARRSHMERALERAAKLPVRHVFRPTRIYASLTRDSLSPSLMRDATLRELMLEGLWRAWIRNPSLPPAVVGAEVDALRELDIPRFRAVPGASYLTTPSGKRVPSVFDAPSAAGLSHEARSYR